MLTQNTIAFITLTNDGYIKYTLNCIESLERIRKTSQNKDGVSIPPLVTYCMGKKGCQELRKRNFPYKEIIPEDASHTEFHTFRRGHFSNITYQKFVIIHMHLLSHDYVCFTDGDIVYERDDLFHYLLNTIQSKQVDLLIQNDGEHDDDHSNLCSGFMFIRSNEKTRALFNPAVMRDDRDTVGWDDQIYINSIKDKLTYALLPLTLFPTGKHYYRQMENKRESDKDENYIPYLIHFNWVRGHKKEDKMRFYGKWY